jgi:hypothetical protein
MARFTLLRRWLIEEHVLTLDNPNLFVASCAPYVLVQAL